MGNVINSLERAYRLAVSAEELANTLTDAHRLAAKTERCLNQLRLAKENTLPPVARKSARRLQMMLTTHTYEQVVEFITTHHYGGCACGCGVAVRNLFKQGHDMKLRHQIKKLQEKDHEAATV